MSQRIKKEILFFIEDFRGMMPKRQCFALREKKERVSKWDKGNW